MSIIRTTILMQRTSVKCDGPGCGNTLTVNHVPEDNLKELFKQQMWVTRAQRGEHGPKRYQHFCSEHQ